MDSERNSPANGRVQFVRENIGWWLLGLILLAIIIKLFNHFIGWIVLGLYLYYMARPISRRLEKRLGRPSLAAASTVLLIAIPFVLVFTVAIVIAVARLKAQLPANLTPVMLQRMVDTLPIVGHPGLGKQLGQRISAEYVLKTGLVVARSAAETGFRLLLTILFALILLVSDRRLVRWVRTELLNGDSGAVAYLTTVDRGVKSIYFGYTITIFVIIIFSAILYNVLNLVAPVEVRIPFPILLAVLTGLFSLLPGVGRPLFFLLVTAYLTVLAVRTDPSRVWFPLVFLVVMLGLFGNVVRIYIRPVLSGRHFPLPLVMFAYLLGPPLFGWYGIFLGPLVLAFLYPFSMQLLPGLLSPNRERPPDTNTHSAAASDEQF